MSDLERRYVRLRRDLDTVSIFLIAAGLGIIADAANESGVPIVQLGFGLAAILVGVVGLIDR